MRFKDMPKLPLALIAAMLAVGAWAYPAMPDRIPVHWGLNGTVDAWSAKTIWSVFQLPLIALGLYALFWVMPYLDPKRGNLIASKRVYALVLTSVSGMLTVLYAAMLLAARYAGVPVERIALVALSVMSIVLGNYLGRVKRNWTMGVRYGWTLSDDTVWLSTNLLGGRLLMVAGALGLVGSTSPAPWNAVLLLVPAFAVLPITYIHSWRTYRRLHPEEMGPVADATDGSRREATEQ